MAQRTPAYRIANRIAADSMCASYGERIALRRGEPALEGGRFEALKTDGDVLAYIRRARRGESEFLVALNLGAELRSLDCVGGGRVVLSTHLDRWQEALAGKLRLRPDEGMIVRLASRA